ncbi:HAMP domain-containing sensor histidine kinase [Clostridium sp. DL1XJH146]
MRKKGLFTKMMLTYTLIIAFSFVILAAFLSLWFESYYFNERKIELENEAKQLGSAAIEYYYQNLSTESLTSMLRQVSRYSNSDIFIVDSYGYLNATSNDNYDSLIGTQIITEDLSSLRLGNSVEKREVFDDILKEPTHTYEVPVFYEDSFKGVILMNTAISQLKEPLQKVYDIIWISAVIAIILSSIVIYYFSQRIIINPLYKINNVAKKISSGEVNQRVNINSNDEIGELAIAFNTMADSLQRVEENRRQFISNVSHELRSPITSIKGFINGILDGIIPKEKENYYLTIVYEEIQRLTRLINDLLDLSAIQAGKLKMNIDKTSLNEVAEASILKFESIIKSKRIDMSVILEDKLYVWADRDKLVQVLTNLIDNAIKYASEDGKIEVETKSRGSKVYISIYNDGPQIDEEDIKHIWDRFYKSDKSRTYKNSSGLGLSIVRSIISGHGEEIWVKNHKNNGVVFTFTLKKI